VSGGPLVVRPETLEAFGLAVLEAWGTPGPIAATTVRLMLGTDLRGESRLDVSALRWVNRLSGLVIGSFGVLALLSVIR
jgi:hypothetical protein